MQWTKCETCQDHTTLGSYLLQIGAKKFPSNEEDRICRVCGKATVILFDNYESLINSADTVI